MITLNNFESFVPYQILERGEDYYETGAVSELEETSPEEWTATVEGTDTYNVEISLAGEEIESWYCDCPYDGEICKHVVATLLAIREDKEKENKSAFSKMSPKAAEEKTIQLDADTQQLLSFTNPQELSQFVCEYASTHPEFKTAFWNRFITKELSAPSKEKDYRKAILKAFDPPQHSKHSRYHNRYTDNVRDWETIFSKLDTFLDKADFFLKQGKIDNTIAIALQILRSIGENYDDELVYNDDFSTSLYCEQAGELLTEVVKHPATTQKQKEEILQELGQIAEISVYRHYDVYDVDELMMQINLSIQSPDKALELIDKLLEERKDSYDLYELVLRKVNLLVEQQEEQKAEETIRQYLYLTEIREREIEKLIARKQYDEALRLLDEGIVIAEKKDHPGTVEQWLETKVKIYELAHRTSEVIDTCRLLFISSSDRLAYYAKLKTLIPQEQWKSFLDAMMKETKFSKYFFLGENDEAEIYVKEKDDERLFNLLSSVDKDEQLEALIKYSHHLKNTYSEQLLPMYTSLLNDYAEQNIGRNHYEKIAKALVCMQKLNGGKEVVKEMVEEFRVQYKRRRAMMDILERF